MACEERDEKSTKQLAKKKLIKQGNPPDKKGKSDKTRRGTVYGDGANKKGRDGQSRS